MDFITAYRNQLNEAMATQADIIAGGGCANIEEYRMKIGFRKGIHFALNRFDDVVRDYVKEETEYVIK